MKAHIIKEFFEKFGKVTYVSLPKFQTSNESKGFAFVEFETKDAAKNSIQVFFINDPIPK